MLTRGLKNWVVEDGRSIEAAMADARRDEERTLASAQLEAFHQTFNFCMDCRQYTCTDCWNQAEGRCLSCAPLPGQLEAEAAGLATAAAFAAPAAPAIVAGPDDEMAWPTSDLTSDEPVVASATEAVTAVPYMPTDLRPVDLPDDDIETMIGAADAAGAEPAPGIEAPAGAEPVAAEALAAIVSEAPALEVEADTQGVAGSTSVAEADIGRVADVAPVTAAAAIVAGEPETEVSPEAAAAIAAEAAEPTAAEAPEPVAATLAAAAAIVAHEPETEVAAEEPEPVAAETPPEPVEEAKPRPLPAPTPGWTIMAPDADETPSAPPAWPPRAPVYQPPAQAAGVQQAPTGEPTQPAWPTMPPAAFTMPAAQAVWEESSLSVISRPGSGVQACVSCGRPLSATARFCRRCGSRQG